MKKCKRVPKLRSYIKRIDHMDLENVQFTGSVDDVEDLDEK